MKKQEPRVLFYDIETFPNIVYTWPGGMYEVNVVKIIKDGELASIAYSWEGEKKVHVLSREGQKSDKQLVEKFLAVLNTADISVAHNGNAFDNKTVNTRTVKHDLHPPTPRKYIDTKVEAKKYFRFNGNSLNELARYLGLGSKVKHDGFDMWEACMADDPSAWVKMRKYNAMDVVLLKALVNEKMRPWIKMPINFRPGTGCQAVGCGSHDLVSHGIRFSTGRAYRRLQCRTCGHWNQETLGTKIIRPLKSL